MGTELFDFDKTLTYRDTTLPLFCYQQTRWRRGVMVVVYYGLAVLVKGGLLKTAELKRLMLQLFYGRWEQLRWEAHCATFAHSIRTNQLYAQTLWEEDQKWVVSASFEAVLRPLFPKQVKLIGSKITKVAGQWQWQQHAFGREKAVLLQKAGVDRADRVYTDSHSDRFMMALATEIVWVAGDKTTCYTRADWERKHGSLPKM